MKITPFSATSSIKTGACFTLLALGLLTRQNALATGVTFTDTPAVVSNTYSGTVTLQISGLTNGETVVVQKFLDSNTNGVIDAGDLLVQQFTLTDGANFVIGGVTNFNVPGDTDGTANGQITAALNFQGRDFVQNMVGNFLYKLSSPVGHFPPITSLFNVTNFPYAQKLTGNVVNSGTNVPYASVILFPPQTSGENGPGQPTAGAVANSSGTYTIQVPPGTYVPMAFRSNFVANYSISPVLTVSSSQTITTNLTLTNATTSISGQVVDAATNSIGLPGVFMPVDTEINGQILIAVCFSTTNGNFTAGVTSGGWSVGGDDSGLIVHGYVGLQNSVDASAGATGVVVADPKATALFYGTVKDNFGNPLANVDINAEDNNDYLYQADAYTGTNGNYVLGVVGSLGNGDPWNVSYGGDSTSYVFSQPAFDQNGGTNIHSTKAVLANFTAILATNTITGYVQDNFGNPISGVGVSANATINGVNYNLNTVDTGTNGDYSLNVANGTWSVYINSGGSGGDNLSTSYISPPNENTTIANDNGVLNFTVQTNINNGGNLQVTTTSLPNGNVNVAYSQELTADGGSPSYYYDGGGNANAGWSQISGSLPSGLSLDSNGFINGTTTNTGTFYFTVQVTDQNNNTAQQPLSLTIVNGALQVTTTSLPDGTTNQAYSQTLTASGGQTPYTWSLVSNSLPAGLSVSSGGVISGTPTVAVTTNFTVKVTDYTNGTATQTLPLTIDVLDTGVGFTITPATVSNTYTGTLTLQMTGLKSNETVTVQNYLDANTNGIIDAGDFLIRQFNLTDGQASVFYDGSTAVTNFNVPGDLNSTTGQITAQLSFTSFGSGNTIIGKYEVRLSSPTGHFLPVTNSFSITNFPYAQSFTGSVVSNGTSTTLPNAVVLLAQPSNDGESIQGGTVANNSGVYTISMAPGTYVPFAFKSNFVANLATAPSLALSSGTINTNLNLIPATQTISGKFVDANSGIGLPGVSGGGVESTDNLLTVYFTGTNGSFTVPVTADQWKVEEDDAAVDLLGYLETQNRTQVNTTTGSVSGITISVPKATAIFYGSVKDNNNNPLAGVHIYSDDNNGGNGQYEQSAYTAINGNYVAGALGGDTWEIEIDSDQVPSLTNYIFTQSTLVNGNTNLAVGQAVQVDFVGILATNYITGNVQFNGDNVSGVGVSAQATINGVTYQSYVDTDNNGNYSLPVASGDWSVALNCDGGNDSLNNLLGNGNYQCPNSDSVTIASNNSTTNFIVQSCNGVQITTTSPLPAGQTEIYYDTQLQASSCYDNFTWTLNDPADFPSDLTLNSDGEIYGTPGTSGTYNFSVNVVDGNNNSTNQSFSLTISGAALQITTASLPNGTNTVFYSQTLQASGGTPPYSWSMPDYSAPLPANLSLATTGVLSGTPSTTTGGYYFDVVVTDSAENTQELDGLLLDIVNPPLAPLVITNTSLPNGTIGVAYSAQLAVTGGQSPYSWSIALGSANPPAGLSLNPSGLISGTPTTNKVSTFKVQVTDTDSDVTNKVLSITINPKPSLGSATKASGTQFKFLLNGASNQNYTLQMSTNLSSTNWLSLFVTNNATTNSFIIADPNATNQQRFYRVLIGP